MSKELFKAIKKQDINEVKKLLESGVNVNYCLDFGETPLLFAIFCNHKNIELIILLIKHGADVNIKNNNDVSPLWICTQSVYFDEFCVDLYKEKIKLAKMLLNNGANLI